MTYVAHDGIGNLVGWAEGAEVQTLRGRSAELVNPAGGVGLSFQRVEGYRAPHWPGQRFPQQVHLSLECADVDEAHGRALRLGARLLHADERLRVYADPAGHPFCISAEGTTGQT